MALSTIAGELGGGILVTCILNEGAPVVSSRAYNKGGSRLTVTTWTTEMQIGDIVSLANDTDNTYVATSGLPVVEVPQNTETLVFGQIMSEPQIVKNPANTAAGDSWAKQLAGSYYRIATIECWIAHSIQKARVRTADASAITPGVGTTIHVDASNSTANHCLSIVDTAGGTGVGCIPLHYLAKLAAGDYNILLAVTGFMYSVT